MSLVRLYPAAWQARYGAEFEALLLDRPPSPRDVIDIVLGAVDARMSPQVVGEPIAISPRQRLAGLSAIAGGLLWCATYLFVGLSQSTSDWTPAVLLALSLMWLSLPGAYMARYRRQILSGVALVLACVAAMVSGVLPWTALFVPAMAILLVLGPGALALATARAGVSHGARWRLLVVIVPAPLIAGTIAAMGLLPAEIIVPLLVVSVLPFGLAWVAAGARITRTAVPTSGGAAA